MFPLSSSYFLKSESKRFMTDPGFLRERISLEILAIFPAKMQRFFLIGEKNGVTSLGRWIKF